MGIQINGANDTISASDGSLSVAGQQLTDVTNINATGIVTATTYVVGAGSASAPSITPSGDPDTGLYSPGADQLALATGGSGRLFVDASGRLGVGNTVMSSFDSWANRLVVGTGSGNNGISIYADSSSRSAIHFADGASGTAIYAGWLIYDHSADAITLATNVTERARIDSSGRLLVGTSTAPSAGGWSQYALLAVSGYRTAPTDAGAFSINRGSAATNGQNIGALAFADNTGNEYATITVQADGVTGTGDYPGRLMFHTTADSGSSPTERMRIDSSGRVGIGTDSPGSELSIKGSGQYAVAQIDSTGATGGSVFRANQNGTNTAVFGVSGWASSDTSSDALIMGYAGNGIRFYTNGVNERARIDSSGRLLVGTSTSRAIGVSAGFPALLQVETTNYTGFSLVNNTNDAFGVQLSFGKSRSTAVGGSAIVQSGDELGEITFAGADGTDVISNAASIRCLVDGTPGANDMPGRLQFATTADGASSPTERARITSSGLFGATTIGLYANNNEHEFIHNVDGKYCLRVQSNSTNANQYGLLVRTTNDQNDSTRKFIQCVGDTTERFAVRTNGGIANVSANNVNISDRNVKKDIAPVADTWDCLKEWEIVNFRYKDQSADVDLSMGVIAQQVAESCPEVIAIFQEAKEATETEPAQEERIGVKEQQMMWMAVKALQEAQTRIEALEAEVAALKGA